MQPANYSPAEGRARSVGDALRIAPGRIEGALKEVVACVDAVHGDGSLPDLSVLGDKALRWPGVLDPRRREICLNTGHPQARLTLAHEIGHAID